MGIADRWRSARRERPRGVAAIVGLIAGILFVAGNGRAEPANDGGVRHGLTVVDGVLTKDGRPYRGIGVNYFNAFARHLADPKDTSYDAGFEKLAKAKIPFARIMGCGFYPSEQRLYRDDPKEFFRRFDAVVQSAEKHGIGLIPCLFWTPYTVPDLVGEPVGQWGNRASKTHQYMRQYVRDVVTRYRHSPAIWGWEFGNEYNLTADLPNAATQRPSILPHLGTPASRSAKDELHYEDIRTALAAFGEEVRKHDSYRMIGTGNSHPRESAWHNWREKSWTKDSPEQQTEMLLADNPDPIDTIGVHLYDDARAAVLWATAEARRAGKPLTIGEFGTAKSRETFQTLLGAIEAAETPLAALWVYDFSWQDKDFNVTWTNARAYQLQAIAEANERIRAHRTNEEK